MIILLISFLILSFTFPFYISPVYASNETYYARVNSDDVFLYKSAVDLTECENVLFILPKTYFVRLTADENSMFYRAEYLGVSGYVKKDSVQVIVGTPTTPYMDNINFRIYAELSRDMRSLPTTNGSNQITYIPLYSRNLTYYGEVVGETLISGRTNKWYYCKYSAGEDFYGYVYSGLSCEGSDTYLHICFSERYLRRIFALVDALFICVDGAVGYCYACSEADRRQNGNGGIYRYMYSSRIAFRGSLFSGADDL